ncbi:hypothetical protein ABF87_08085 [Nitrosomonas sp. JL21]|uniref:hypothetical protein n=1 Tax=Nitrosomonas sp. JL21 TaxID=153949 RepID=UPI001371C431|nr:hypothetical protein [Nitrosomonas sp. JL21]MXS77922.1 hypothetical protein [Nitrosomonas sp. JL21]
MDETRRSLIKGVLTGGTLLALGIPVISQAASVNQALVDNVRNCHLLLGNTPIDEEFARGAQAACSLYGNYLDGTLPTFQLEDELLISPLHIGDLLAQSCNMRWIAIMDYANAAIFNELIRNSGRRLLALGSHIFTSNNKTIPLRHVWTVASPEYSAAGLLASTLSQNQHDFSIVENFLEQSIGDGVLKNTSLAEFSSYWQTDQPATHIHCSGMSPEEASQLIGWKTSEKTKALFSQVASSSNFSNRVLSDVAIDHPRFDDWIEATGFAVVATALGVKMHQQTCSSRAFVYRSDQRNHHRHELSEKSFVSFVIDV